MSFPACLFLPLPYPVLLDIDNTARTRINHPILLQHGNYVRPMDFLRQHEAQLFNLFLEAPELPTAEGHEWHVRRMTQDLALPLSICTPPPTIFCRFSSSMRLLPITICLLLATNDQRPTTDEKLPMP